MHGATSQTMRKVEYEILRQKSGPIYNDIRLHLVMQLAESGYVSLHESGWKSTRKGDDFLQKFDRVLTTFSDSP